MNHSFKEQFHAEMLNVYRRAKAECNYNATRFLQIVNRRGGLAAAKELLRSVNVPDGLTRLWEEGRLDISMEALILRGPWKSLFTSEEIQIAQRRLKDLGFTNSEV